MQVFIHFEIILLSFIQKRKLFWNIGYLYGTKYFQWKQFHLFHFKLMRRFHFQRLKDKQSTFCMGKTLLNKKVVFNQLPWNNLYSERHSLLWKQKVTKWKWKFWIKQQRGCALCHLWWRNFCKSSILHEEITCDLSWHRVSAMSVH